MSIKRISNRVIRFFKLSREWEDAFPEADPRGSIASQSSHIVEWYDNEDMKYNTNYYVRNTIRVPHTINLTPQNLKEPMIEGPAPHHGRVNEDVARYDPTGLRSAMTASDEALYEVRENIQPEHFPTPLGELVEEGPELWAEKHNLPPLPGRCLRGLWEVPENEYNPDW